MSKILSAKHPTEIVTVTFDYAREHPGATLTAPAIVATVDNGTDGSPGAILSGAPQVQGLRILQSVIGGLAFVDYKLRCTATVNGVLTSVRTAVLPVRTL